MLRKSSENTQGNLGGVVARRNLRHYQMNCKPGVYVCLCSSVRSRRVGPDTSPADTISRPPPDIQVLEDPNTIVGMVCVRYTLFQNHSEKFFLLASPSSYSPPLFPWSLARHRPVSKVLSLFCVLLFYFLNFIIPLPPHSSSSLTL